jgi:hypothetical protein
VFLQENGDRGLMGGVGYHIDVLAMSGVNCSVRTFLCELRSWVAGL